MRFDSALLWGFEVCVDERKWSTMFRQAPNEGIKKLCWPFPILTSQAQNKISVRACVHKCVCVEVGVSAREANLSDLIKHLAVLPLTYSGDKLGLSVSGATTMSLSCVVSQLKKKIYKFST